LENGGGVRKIEEVVLENEKKGDGSSP